ncbi:hypothetical protein POL68_28515 [Stigmatella sp. ncwal1]|uniref:Outer membrane protein beta-barrel domain-containing protein n=1 Tax=Stigmatella ashevillensis TaxID=2995309 RepID=A0ABT5DFJ0_9BACT|nr:hypothetical protein [Stigmatella ashevillena]MDC0712439.1 hypothetical protein [Stigmatella ashevillena]
MRMQWGITAAALLMGLLGTGCASISHVQTADTLGQGKFQFAVEPGIQGVGILSEDDSSASAADFDDIDDGDSDFDGAAYPHVDLALRYGVTDRFDLGIRLGFSLAELQTKFLLTSPDNPDLAISLAPSISGVYIGSDDDDVGYTNLALPLLIGFKTDGGSEFVLGPRVSGARVSVGGDDANGSVNVLSVGGSIGYALRIGSGFRLMPEVAFSVPVVGSVNSSDSDSEVLSGFDGGFFQVKLGFLFGEGRPIRRAPPSEATFD